MVVAQQQSNRRARYVAAGMLVALLAAGYWLRTATPSPVVEGDKGSVAAGGAERLPVESGETAAAPTVATTGKAALPEPAAATAAAETAPDEPVRHEAALSQVEAVEQFPGSFDDAVSAGDTERATRIMRNKLLDMAATGGDAFALLKPYLEAHEFLWQDQTLVAAQWSGCLAQGCDQKEFRAALTRLNPTYAAERGACLDAWGTLMPLLSRSESLKDPQAARTAKPLVEACLAHGGFQASEVVTPLQFYLGLVRQSQGEEALQREFAELSGRYPGMPPLASLIPQ